MKNLLDNESNEMPQAIKDCVEEISATDAGLIFLQYMHAICGYSRPSVVLDSTGRVEHEATLANEARRALYIELRKYIPREKLILVELPELEEPKPIQDKLTVRGKLKNAGREHERSGRDKRSRYYDPADDNTDNSDDQ